MENIYQKLLYELNEGRDAVMVTITKTEGSTPGRLGSSMLITKLGLVYGTIGGGSIEYVASKKAAELLEEKKSENCDYELSTGSETEMACGGKVSLAYKFFDNADSETKKLVEEKAGLSQQTKAYLFGGGHIAKALCPILASVGFDVTVMDNREEFASKERFPAAEQVVLGDYEHIDNYFNFTKDDFTVVATNGHSFDTVLEYQLLQKDLAYIGVVGSKKKIATVNGILMEKGISEERCRFVHTPIGMSIKAVTPEEIAVSIAGEMIMVRAEQREAKAAE